MPPAEGQPKSKYKRWLINILILIVVVLLMLALSEIAFRWLDGYNVTTIELNQNSDAIPFTQ